MRIYFPSCKAEVFALLDIVFHNSNNGIFRFFHMIVYNTGTYRKIKLTTMSKVFGYFAIGVVCLTLQSYRGTIYSIYSYKFYFHCAISKSIFIPNPYSTFRCIQSENRF